MEVREGPIPPPGGKKGEMKIETFTCSEEKRGKNQCLDFFENKAFFVGFFSRLAWPQGRQVSSGQMTA